MHLCSENTYDTCIWSLASYGKCTHHEFVIFTMGTETSGVLNQVVSRNLIKSKIAPLVWLKTKAHPLDQTTSFSPLLFRLPAPFFFAQRSNPQLKISRHSSFKELSA